MAKLAVYTILLVCFLSCITKEEKVKSSKFNWHGLEVTVSAYNSVVWQTQGNPNIAAWGDTLKPGMKVVAVSRDLLALGITHNSMITIDSMKDTFLVKDKMNRRWRKRIDIYMGKDVKKARKWGRQKLFICYAIPKDSTTKNSIP
ncbi:3D domain-containing protein [uncultured Croceitalea sp.]|uniref:3D domain-containing protein n=1 Tax=uncultured Croceitalea sp. TaxID=1798908 RepID=UPI00374E5020